MEIRCRRRASRVTPTSSISLATILSSYCLSGVRADDVLTSLISNVTTFAGTQLTVLADDVLVTNDVFTDYTDEDGLWITEDSDGDPEDNTVWTSGMVVGLFWYQYALTGEAEWKERAEYFTLGMEGTEVLDDNDLGFQVFNSFGLGYKLTGESSYLDNVLTAAETLYDLRYDDNIPAFWSWANPSSRPEWERAVNVDMMMNMEIMLWAAENGGNETWSDAVERHADLTWKDIVRDDNSTFHVADYDPDTGELVDQGTYQGATDDSTWSRGQAWAVYGYIMVYRFWPRPRFLEYCIGLLEYFLEENADDNIPYSDFDADIDDDNPKDSSSTAIVSSALLEIFQVTGEPTYLETAQTYLKSVLSGSYYEPDAEDGWQSILRRASAKYGDPEVGAIFGDYFLLEAVLRYKEMAPSILLREETVVVTTGSETSTRRSRRKLQTLEGGTFCSVEIQDGKIVFTDPDCVPQAPEFVSASEGGDATSAPAATPAPTAGSREIGTPAPVLAAENTPAPVEVAVTFEPTAAGSSDTVVAEAVFTSEHLVLDVDLTGLSDTSEVLVWFGITLMNVDLVPILLEIEGEGAAFTGVIDAPTDDWTTGENTVVLTFTGGTFDSSATSSWEEVVRVVIGFSAADSTAPSATNNVTINHLVLGHALDL